jgi:hypothetical protein
MDQDKGRFDADLPRAGITLGFELVGEDAEPKFYVKTEAEEYPTIAGIHSYTTEYSYRQFWAEVAKFPVSGVIKNRISPNLIEMIAAERISRNYKVPIRTRFRYVGEDEARHVQLRGFIPSGRPCVDNTRILEVLNEVAEYKNPQVPNRASFDDHVFSTTITLGNVESGSQRGTAILAQPCLVIFNSEVNALVGTVDSGLYFPEFNASVVLPGRHMGFKVRDQHNDPRVLLHDLEVVVKEASEYRDKIQETLNTAWAKEVGPARHAADAAKSRFKFIDRFTNSVYEQMKENIVEDKGSSNALTLALSVAQAASKLREEVRLPLLVAAGRILTQ